MQRGTVQDGLFRFPQLAVNAIDGGMVGDQVEVGSAERYRLGEPAAHRFRANQFGHGTNHVTSLPQMPDPPNAVVPAGFLPV